MTTEVETLFTALWSDFITRLCPSADEIHQLMTEHEALENDHIALRTFNLPSVGIDVVAAPFLAMGYRACGEYLFESKKLSAKHYEHPNPSAPKVFISELMVEQCSPELQEIVHSLVSQVPDGFDHQQSFLYGGRPWTLSYEQYQQLAQESEYAGWLAAHGFGANHFTVNVNQLNNYDEVVEVNRKLRSVGFTINDAGGEVKGTPEVFLEQSSTMSDRVEVLFSDGKKTIPGGFYEFAKRYPLANGYLYQGFVAASADKIFESTNN
jgi:hypothetical protein